MQNFGGKQIAKGIGRIALIIGLLLGLFLLYGGIATSVISLGSNSGGGFLLGTAAGISGSIIAIVNKNRRINKRAEIAKIYNGSFQQ